MHINDLEKVIEHHARLHRIKDLMQSILLRSVTALMGLTLVMVMYAYSQNPTEAQRVQDVQISELQKESEVARIQRENLYAQLAAMREQVAEMRGITMGIGGVITLLQAAQALGLALGSRKKII